LSALRAALGDGFPTTLNETGETYKRSVEMLSGGDRPNFDQAWEGPLSFSGITTAQALAMAGSGLTNSATTYQFDTDPAVSAAERDFNASIVRVPAPSPSGPRLDGALRAAPSRPT
jgi:hypothetical protein